MKTARKAKETHARLEANAADFYETRQYLNQQDQERLDAEREAHRVYFNEIVTANIEALKKTEGKRKPIKDMTPEELPIHGDSLNLERVLEWVIKRYRNK